jgi:hypothetical protein
MPPHQCAAATAAGHQCTHIVYAAAETLCGIHRDKVTTRLSSPRSEPLSDASCVRGPRSMAPGTVPATSTFARVLTFRRYSGASILAACGQPWNIAGVLGT